MDIRELDAIIDRELQAAAGAVVSVATVAGRVMKALPRHLGDRVTQRQICDRVCYVAARGAIAYRGPPQDGAAPGHRTRLAEAPRPPR